jgi:hypothetical protein
MRTLARWRPDLDGPAELPQLRRFWRYQQVLAGEVTPAADSGAAEWIVWAAKKAYETGQIPADAGIRDLLADWRKAQRSAAEIDLAPALATCALLDMRGVSEGKAATAQAAVTSLYQVGRLAERSMHVEALAVRWLGQPERWGQGGIWERLRFVLFDPAQESRADRFPQEVEDDRPIHDLARSQLERVNPPLSDPIVRSLLAAIGSLHSGEHLLQDAPVLARVAGLGRGLTPAASQTAAQRSLLDCQRTLLRDLFVQVTRSGQPYLLIAPVAGRPA